jgi:hypothetical protein
MANGVKITGKGKTIPLTGIEAKIIEVSFISSIKVAIAKKQISAPHWKAGEKVAYKQVGYGAAKNNDYGSCSIKPAAYSLAVMTNGYYADVKINVTKLENISGTAVLNGRLLGLEFEGEFQLSTGIHIVRVKLTNSPDSIQWYKAPIKWRLKVKNKPAVKALNSTFVEVFFILDVPAVFYSNGTWAEALRFLCNKIGIINTKKDKSAASIITQYSHGKHGLYYDSKEGGRSYYGVSGDGGLFKLENYLNRKSIFANCYDQAGAIQSLCGAVGVKLQWIFMNPFGYINETNLLGYGACNNPFFKMNGTKQIIGRDDSDRTGFGNHAFCKLRGIHDACAGPHRGDSKEKYVTDSIDNKTKLYISFGGRAGTIADMKTYSGVTGVE